MTVAISQRAGVALLIGIGEYRKADRIAPLPYATHDVRALARLFADPAVCAFPQERVVRLTDQRARRDKVVHRLSKWLPEQARGAEIVVIYFAGHGVVEKIGSREEGYLLPHDADPDDIVTHGVAMSDLARWIEAIEAGAVVVCLDCCHAGKVLGREGVSFRATPRDMELKPAVLQQIAGRGRFLIASCDEGQQSLEVEQLKHGLFTYHLLQGLAGAGDQNGDGKVGVAELFEYVSASVARDAREQFGREQRPWTSAVHAGEVYLSAPRAPWQPPSTLNVLETLRHESAPPPDPLDLEEKLDEADEETLLARLRQIRATKDPAGVPTVFHCLAHKAEAVRERARKAVHAIGWERVCAAVEALARAENENRIGHVLDGLAALETHPDVVGLLDRLVILLRGRSRDRAVFLLERKRPGLELDRLATVFREKQSPYQLQRVLGAGLFTAAYLARHELTGLEVVVRVLRPEFAAQPLLRSEFVELSRRSHRFVHHNLVLTRDVGAFADRDIYYTVRDYVAGPTLREVLEGGKRFGPAQIREILRQIAEALTPLHQDGAAHGAVKPSNVFLTKGDRVLLGEPSLAVPGTSFDLKRLSYDFRYAPPEMFRGGGSLEPRSDFYSLGCVAYELFCGEPPFVSDNPYELIARHERDPVVPMSDRPGATADVLTRLAMTGHCKTFVQRLLAKSADSRFHDLSEFLRELRDVDRTAVPQTLAASGPVQSVSAPPPPSPLPGAPLMNDASLAGYDQLQSIVPLGAVGSADEATGMDLGGPSPAAGPPAAPEPLPSIPDYDILERIGAGGMGQVYKARQVRLDRPVALKMIAAGVASSPEALARFRREALAAAKLQHPNIVQIYDADEYQGTPYLAMEFVNGTSLSQRLRQGPLPEREAAALVARLAEAVYFAHAHGIIHRDLKPSNVLLTAEGEPKITDFGLAKRLGEEEAALTHVGMVMGTPAYMAPEQAGGEPVTPAADIYALGVMLYEALTGQRPFKATGSLYSVLQQVMMESPPPPRALRPELSRDLEQICLKCLEKDPDQRYRSAKALAEDLQRFLTGKPIQARAEYGRRSRHQAPRVAPAAPMLRAGRRRPARWLWAAGLLGAALLGALWYFVLAAR